MKVVLLRISNIPQSALSLDLNSCHATCHGTCHAYTVSNLVG